MELYKTHKGNIRVNTSSGVSYAVADKGGGEMRDIHGKLPGDELSGRQLMLARAGEYGSELSEYVQACEKCGVLPRYAWSGVVNSMGDHESASPPWKPRGRDEGR